MTTIVLASTLYGLATAVTVLDNEPSSTDDRRLLVVSNNALMAEIVPDLNELDGFDAVAGRFDDVVSLNELIAPYHPSGWRPSMRSAGASWSRLEGKSAAVVCRKHNPSRHSDSAGAILGGRP